MDAPKHCITGILASALKYGTTRHLAPHSDQGTKGPHPLRWRKGDDDFNFKAMLETSYANTREIAPEIEGLRYDFDNGGFYDKEGRAFTDGQFEQLATTANRRAESRAGRPGKPSAASGSNRDVPTVGSRTLKRAVVSGSAARSDSKGTRGARPGLVEEAGGELQAELDPALRKAFYSAIGPEAPAGGMSKEAAEKVVAKAAAHAKDKHGMTIKVISDAESRKLVTVPEGKRAKGFIGRRF